MYHQLTNYFRLWDKHIHLWILLFSLSQINIIVCYCFGVSFWEETISVSSTHDQLYNKDLKRLDYTLKQQQKNGEKGFQQILGLKISRLSPNVSTFVKLKKVHEKKGWLGRGSWNKGNWCIWQLKTMFSVSVPVCLSVCVCMWFHCACIALDLSHELLN